MKIESAEYLSGKKLKLTFSDGHAVDVDFKQAFASLAGEMRSYNSPATFKGFIVSDGLLYWANDEDVIFKNEDLYKGFAPSRSQISSEELRASLGRS